MRVLHTSDWHLGRTLEGRPRLDEQREVLDEICRIAEAHDVHLVLVAGDVFDTYNPPAEAEELFYQALERLSAGGRRAVVAIAGNHDSPERLCAAGPLALHHGIFLVGRPGWPVAGTEAAPGAAGGGTPGAGGIVQTELAALSEEELYTQPAIPRRGPAGSGKAADRTQLVGQGPGWVRLALPGCAGQAVVAVLPYPSEARLNEMLSGSLEEAEQQAAYAERIALAWQQACAAFRPDTVNLAVSHLYVAGGRESDSERQIQLGGAYSIPAAALPAGAQYVALGHLHRPQGVPAAKAPCRYSGSPLCYSFSEADQQKEVVLVDVEPGLPARVQPLPLQSGKPLKQWCAASLEEAQAWCSRPENQRAWVDLEIAAPGPLADEAVSELRRAHPGLINIRVVRPEAPFADQALQPSQLSLAENFRVFARRQLGAEPEQELVDLFLALAHEVEAGGGQEGEEMKREAQPG